MSTCKVCPARLGPRNKSGYCRKHFSQNVPMSEESRRKLSETIRKRCKADPEFKADLQKRARKASTSPGAVKARTERWHREKVWEKGNKAARKPEVRAKAAIATRNTRLAWCPPHLRQDYLDLIYKNREKAADAKKIILDQHDAELRRFRARIKLARSSEESDAFEPTPNYEWKPGHYEAEVAITQKNRQSIDALRVDNSTCPVCGARSCEDHRRAA